jgi:hypothetical protein
MAKMDNAMWTNAESRRRENRSVQIIASCRAPWREPRQLVISILLDDRGRPDERFTPVFDATIGDANQFFIMSYAYLEALGARKAKQMIFVADGASSDLDPGSATSA